MGFNIRLTEPAARALRPVIPDNARGLCITAAAGTELATPYSPCTIRAPSLKDFVKSLSEGAIFSIAKAVYAPRGFFLHAASLDQAFAHCRMFLTAATRRCMTRLSVSSLGIVLSHPLPVIALVGRYPANKLIGPRPLFQ